MLFLDEVHHITEIGATLECVVTRLKRISAMSALANHPIGSLRIIALSATLPNPASVAAWSVWESALPHSQFWSRVSTRTTHGPGENVPIKKECLPV